MGFMDEYNKALKENVSAKAAATSGSAGVTKVSGGSSPNYVGAGHESFYSGSSGKGGKTFDAPIITTRVTGKKKKKKEKEKEKRSWFKKGLFEDGYDFGDISRTILGTATDTLENLGTGIIGMGEKAVDAMAYIAPYAANGQFYQNGGIYTLEQQKQHEKVVEQSKKDLGKFIAKDLYDEEKISRAIISDPARMIGIDSEAHSVFGEKSDALIQSGGQLLATAGMAAAGLPWWATTGVTSFGSEAENAMNQGATYEQAGASAAISAGAEILSEKLSGGISFGGKTLDDALTKQLARGISNKLGRTAAKLGLDMAGEGAEEVFSQIASNVGSSLYKEENLKELLTSEEAMEEYLESFIGGAALGGVAGSYNAVKSNRSGVDYTSGLTENEQKVVDKLYKDEIASREKEGKVSQKEKAKIYDSILEDMEKGYISTDTIEEVLGGEKYSQYKQVAEWEDSLQTEFDKLNKMQQGQMTGEQIDRREALRTQIKNVKATSGQTQFRNQIRDEVMGLVKGDRLAESYNERARTGQKFEADVTKYDTKQQAVVQKAIDSGILNNSNRTHEFVDFVSKISADTGVLFDFSNTAKIREAGFAVDGQTVDGFITKDGITVNIDSPKSRQFVVGHEITHALEGTELYDALRKSVFDYAKMKNQYGVRMESIQKRYKEGTDYEAELTADLVGEYIFSDTDFINNLSTQNRNVFQKVYDEIKYLCKVATAGSKEARELEKVKRAFENAYREGGKTQGDTKYSVSDSAGKELTAEQQEYFKDSKMRDENGNLKVMYHGSQDAGFHTFDSSKSDDGTSFFFVDRNDVAASYSGTSETYEAKTIRTAEDMNNFLAEIDHDDYEAVEENGKFVLYQDGEYVATSDTAQGIYEEFCWYEGVGEGDANYKVYLNLKNPLEVDAQDRNWNNVSREYSQEVADRYDSLTAEEKDALHDIAGWGEISIFRDEIRHAKDGALASAYEKMGDVNMYDLFTIAEDNFSEDTIKQFAVKQMNTRDYAQKAKAEGYDGVIFKNIHDNGGYSNGSEGASTVAIAFDSSQIKSVANAKPTADPDIRYSLSDSNGRELSKEQSEYFKDSKVRDKNGSLQVMYHGSPESFTVFDKKKAKSSGLYGKGFYFTNSDSHAKQYGNTYEVYLNITNPLQNGTNDITKDQLRAFVEAIAEDEDYGIENYGYEATVDSVTNNVFGKGDFSMLMDINVTCVGNMVEAIELFNKVNGTDYNGIIAPTETVAFYPEQIKEVANQKPTADKDIRFSLSDTVEETKDLMALHNLTSEKLMKSLKLGGLPMPSVVIAKAKDGHSEFGEISLILPRETIDPETSSRNKLYSGDAWTPTYPKVEYKPNSKVLKKVENKVSKLVSYDVQDVLGNLMFDTDNARDMLDRYNGNMAEAFSRNDAMKYAYLKDTGNEIELPTKEKDLVHYGRQSNAAVRYFAGKLVNGLQTVELYQNMGARELTKDKALAEAVADAQNFDVLRTLEPGSQEYLEYERNPVFLAEDVTFRDIDDFLTASRKLFTYGVQQTVDRNAAREMLKDIDQTAYEGWLENLFSGIVEKEGIRNEKELFTPSGNRRSFEALHYENNLENVVKAMREKGEKGIGFGGGNIFGAATTEFSSVDDMKQASDRLQHMSEEEYQEIKDGFTQRFLDLAGSLPKNKNSWTATDDAANALIEAVAKYQTKRGIANYLRRELDGWATYSPQVVDDLIELVNDIRSMPTGYFEAKPQRAVGFDEVAVFVIPYDADVKLKQELLNKGYSIAEYDPKVEGDRTRVLNQFEEYKFSLSNAGEQHTPDSLSALRLDAPVAENATTPTVAENSTVQPETQLTEENATVTAEDMSALFPNNAVPVQEELEQLISERDEIYGALEIAVDRGSAAEVGKLAEEYEALNTRIKELESKEAERTGSLTDADVPPEMDAPFYGESSEQPVPDDPFYERDISDVGKRSVKAYQYENPEVKPFFQEAALGMLYDVANTTKGEKWYNDELYYASGGEKGFGGTKRSTTPDIAELKDVWGYTYDQIEKGLQAIIEDDGKENNAVSKRIEFMLNDRLLNGYKDVEGRPYEPNQDYIRLLNEKQITEYSKEAFDSFMLNADQYAPPAEDVAPVKPLSKATPDTMDAPIFESKDKNAVKGQTTMFEPEKPKTSGRVARVLTEESKPREKQGIGMKAVSSLVDKGMVFENLSLDTGNMEVQAKWNSALPANTEKRAQYFMENGAEGVKPHKEIAKEIKTAGEEDFYNYVYHVHNIDRMTLDERFGLENMPVYGETYTAAESMKEVQKLEKAHPEFKAIAEDVYAYFKHLKNLLVEDGCISQELSDWLDEKYPHYVPIRRVDENGKAISVPLDTNKTGVNTPLKRATGGSSDIEPLITTMAMRAEQTYSAIARNRFGIELKNTLGTTLTKKKTDAYEVMDSVGVQEDLLKQGTMGGNPTFTVFENGERVEFEIDEDMYDALKPAGKLLGHRNDAITKVSNWRRNLLTTWNPVFALYRNPVKDLQDVMINSQHPAKTYAKVFVPTKDNVIWQIASHGKWAAEYESNGGKGSTYFDSKKRKFKPEDNIFKKTIGFPVRALENAGEFIEEIPRLAEYIASRKEGRSIDRSMLDAARVTTNFAAGGDATRFANAHGFTFLNASVQGASQHVRNFREATRLDGMKGFVKTLAKYTLAGIPGIVLNNMIWDDDEEYEELSDYVKQNYYVVAKTKDGKFFRIPKGRTAAVMQNALEQMQHLITGDDEADFGTFYELFMNNIAPNNPIENNILSPFMQVKNNRAWYGDDLVPSRLQKLPTEEQFDESTDALSKWLGENFDPLDLGPYKINYLLDQYSGGLGDMFLPMMTPEAESGDNTFVGNMLAPWKKEMTTDSTLNNKNPGNFYELKDELDVVSNGKNATEEDKMKSQYLDSVSWEMGDLYAQKREIQNSDLPDDQKYEQVREIQEQINEIANNALNKYNHVKVTGLYSEAGDRRYNKDVESGKWYEIKPKNADGSDNWYYQKEQEVTKGLGISYEEYWNNREEYNYAYDKPGRYAIAQAVGGYDTYMRHYDVLENWQSDSYLSADKDSKGNSISGSRKEKVLDYINGLDIDYGERLILYRTVYSSKSDKRKYNQDIINYLNDRDDISYDEMKSILEELDMEVDSEGNISW